MALVLCVEQLLPFLIYFRPLNWFNLYLIIVSIKFVDVRIWTGYIWVGSNHSVHCATADALNCCTLAKLCSSNRNDKFVFISGSRSLRVFHHRSETLFISNVYIMVLSWPTRNNPFSLDVMPPPSPQQQQQQSYMFNNLVSYKECQIQKIAQKLWSSPSRFSILKSAWIFSCNLGHCHGAKRGLLPLSI